MLNIISLRDCQHSSTCFFPWTFPEGSICSQFPRVYWKLSQTLGFFTPFFLLFFLTLWLWITIAQVEFSHYQLLCSVENKSLLLHPLLYQILNSFHESTEQLQNSSPSKSSFSTLLKPPSSLIQKILLILYQKLYPAWPTWLSWGDSVPHYKP